MTCTKHTYVLIILDMFDLRYLPYKSVGATITVLTNTNLCRLLLIYGMFRVLRLKADCFRYRRKLYGLNVFVAISVHLKLTIWVRA